MIDKLTSITEFLLKIPAALLAAFIVTISIILFVPEDTAKTLSVDGFREQYRVFLGPAFILFVAIASARLIQIPISAWKTKKLLIKRQEALHNLTPQEKGYLTVYILGQQNTINVGVNDGVMCGLVSKRITYLASTTGTTLDGFPFNLSDWARKYLNANPHLLEGAVGSPRTPQQLLHDY